MRAIYLILSKLSEDVHYPPNLSSPFPYAGWLINVFTFFRATCSGRSSL
uniref:Uncharacterized protein n=1 Tax=Aegilops tauschii subsp. strangulata TaxID=200361 RepID=A0A453QQ33_AEGTS